METAHPDVPEDFLRGAVMELKSLLLFCGALIGAAPVCAVAQPANPYEACGRITDPQARLACYDSSRSPVSAAPQQIVPQPYVARAPARAVSSSVSDFGLRHGRSSLQRVMAGVQWHRFNDRGKFTVGLDNGQVWRQFNDDTARAKFSDGPQRDSVLIKHGFFESYDLKLNRMNAVFRVERIE
jgi:hypothetical protein